MIPIKKIKCCYNCTYHSMDRDCKDWCNRNGRYVTPDSICFNYEKEE
jgi:hypothetical protein